MQEEEEEEEEEEEGGFLGLVTVLMGRRATYQPTTHLCRAEQEVKPEEEKVRGRRLEVLLGMKATSSWM